MIKYHNKSHSASRMVSRNVTAQTVYQNCFSCNNSKDHLWYRMGYIVIFVRLAGIPNVALLVPPIVHHKRDHAVRAVFATAQQPHSSQKYLLDSKNSPFEYINESTRRNSCLYSDQWHLLGDILTERHELHHYTKLEMINI